MIHLMQTSIWEPPRTAALVVPVNCRGVMGAGMAKEFAQRFPAMADAYRLSCKQYNERGGGMHPGEVLPLPVPGGAVLFAFTKDDWRNPSEFLAIQACIMGVYRTVRKQKLTSVKVPALGCGLGGLLWADVLPLMETAFETLPTVDWYIYP